MATRELEPESRNSKDSGENARDLLRLEFSASSGVSAARLEDKQSKLLKEEGVLASDSDTTKYIVVLENKTVNLDFDKSKDISVQLKEKKERLISAIENEYPVKILRTGDDLVRQRTVDKNGKSTEGEMLKARDPVLAELIGLESALRLSKSTVFLRKNADELKMKIAFSDTLTQPHKADTAAEYWWDPKQALTVFFSSKSARHSLAMSIETNGIHEFGHRHQDLRDWQPRLDDGGKSYISSRLGWEHLGNGKLALKAKDGALYVHQRVLKESVDADGKTSLKEEKTWLKVDKIGRALDRSGKAVKPAEEHKAEKLDNESMRDKALVKPASNYFDNPIENYTEGLTSYRKGTQSRFTLRLDSPELYKEVSAQDQDEIDLYFQEFKPGLKGMRSLNGEIIETSPEAKAEIQKFERLVELIQAIQGDARLPALSSQVDNGIDKSLGSRESASSLLKRLEPLERESSKLLDAHSLRLAEIENIAFSMGIKLSQVMENPNFKLFDKRQNLPVLLFAASMSEGDEQKARRYLNSLCRPDKLKAFEMPKKGSKDLDLYIDALDQCRVH